MEAVCFVDACCYILVSKLESNLCFFQIFESSESAGQLELNILGSGHLLVSQGQELLVRLYENTQDLASDQ